MAVYREGFKILEEISKNSGRVFQDAADYGCKVKKGDYFFNCIKQLLEFYGDEGTRTESSYGTGVTISQKVTLIDEWAVSDERKTIEQATEHYTVTYVKSNRPFTVFGKEYNGYVYIENQKGGVL